MGKTNKERMVKVSQKQAIGQRWKGLFFLPWKAGGLLIISLSGFSIGSSGGQIWLRMIERR